MANALYVNYKNLFLGGGVGAARPDMDSNDIKCVLTDHGGDTPVVATDQDLADISAGTIDTSPNMAGAAIAGGAIDYDNFTFTAVAGVQSESLNWYNDSVGDILILYMDTATGLPVTPNGGDINVLLNVAGLYGFI